jgi:hypothetical protein
MLAITNTSTTDNGHTTNHVATSTPPPPSHQETEAAAGARDVPRLEPQVCLQQQVGLETHVSSPGMSF